MKSQSLILIIATALALCMSACGSKNSTTDKDMTKLTFNERQAAAMAVIACHEARGDLSSLAVAIHEGFEVGLTANQLKEALSQLYAYTGFPRSLNALGTLKNVMEQRGDVEMGPEASPMPAGYDALKQGTEVQTRLSGQPFNYDFCPAEDYYLKAHLFGDIFARDVLTHADRELVTVSALSGLEGVMPQLQAHVRGALNMGVSDEQLAAIPVALKAAGLEAEALRCEAAIATVKGQQQVVSPSAYPLGQPNDAYAKYFIGQSYLARHRQRPLQRHLRALLPQQLAHPPRRRAAPGLRQRPRLVPGVGQGARRAEARHGGYRPRRHKALARRRQG